MIVTRRRGAPSDGRLGAAENFVYMYTISSSNITMTAYPSITDLNNNSNGKSGTGASGQYVLYSATYPYTFMTSYLMPGGTKKSITVNTVVKNEYY